MPRQGPTRAGLAVEIPLGAPGRYASEPRRALHARLDVRRLAERLFARGFEATGIVPGTTTALCLFER